ncbi:DUF1294 domain-containing protein [Devosia chinhatensis]|uniref:CSD domain-containing protein n=1 Tax=Devosia chinhatensis TaxID=429727 RepID=A0A0F5FG27_9HYPH|nr:DUF1294 domain-containing protein [Devosia chinhatensis]KKB07859.1 hypothetical protein VE26_14565 [Devosia chinhatensis]
MLTGNLMQWNDARGFGFVVGDDGKRYFLHVSEIARIATRPRQGDRLRFEPALDREGRLVARKAVIAGANLAATRDTLRRGQPKAGRRLEWRYTLGLVLAFSIGVGVLEGRLPWAVLPLYLIMGTVSFLLYRADKRFAEEGRWRISEAMLLACDLAFGIVGGLLGQAVFRHKTAKPSFIAFTLLIGFVHLLWLIGFAAGWIQASDLLELAKTVGSV